MRSAWSHGDLIGGLRHFAYAAGWKKFEPLWDLVIRLKRAGTMLPVLEAILSEFGRRNGGPEGPPYKSSLASNAAATCRADP